MALKFKCPECNNDIITKHISKSESMRCPLCLEQIIVPEDAKEINFSEEAEKFLIKHREGIKNKLASDESPSMIFAAGMAYEKPPWYKKEVKHGCLLPSIIFIIVIIMISIFNESPEYDSQDKGYPNTSKNISDATVYMHAREYVRNQLVSPATAKFPTYLDAKIVDLGNYQYEVYGYVDSQNRLGAVVRAYYECTLQLDSSGNSAEILFFAFVG